MHFLRDSLIDVSKEQIILSTIKVVGRAGDVLWVFNI